jgi:hypothetical protein
MLAALKPCDWRGVARSSRSLLGAIPRRAFRGNAAFTHIGDGRDVNDPVFPIPGAVHLVRDAISCTAIKAAGLSIAVRSAHTNLFAVSA